jgi:hypothetical protein
MSGDIGGGRSRPDVSVGEESIEPPANPPVDGSLRDSASLSGTSVF